MSCSVTKIVRYDSRMNVCDVMLQTVRQERRILYKFVFSLIAGGVMLLLALVLFRLRLGIRTGRCCSRRCLCSRSRRFDYA